MSQRTHSTAHRTAPQCTLHTSHPKVPGSQGADSSPHSRGRLPGITHPPCCTTGLRLGPRVPQPAPRTRSSAYKPVPQSTLPRSCSTTPLHKSYSAHPGCSRKPTGHKTNTIRQRPCLSCRTLACRAQDAATSSTDPPTKSTNSRHIPRSTHPESQTTAPTAKTRSHISVSQILDSGAHH